MKKMNGMAKAVAVAGLSLALVAGLAGCASGGDQKSGASSAERVQSSQSADAAQDSSAAQEEMDLSFSKRDLDYSYDEASATKVQLSDGGITVDGEGAIADGSTLTLSAAGTYIISGSLSDGDIVIEAGDEDKLQVVFDGVSVTNSDGPALMVENADKVFVTLAEGSKNSLADGSNYDLAGDDDNRDATLFSRDDITINGTGSLSIAGNYSHAVVSKDDLVIAGATIDVTSREDGFQGKDCLKVTEANITVNAGDDGLKSDAYVYIKDGNIDVQTCYEGYEGEKVIIDGGTHSILADDDAINAALSDSSSSTTTGTSFGGAPAATTGVSFGGAPSGMNDGTQGSSKGGNMNRGFDGNMGDGSNGNTGRGMNGGMGGMGGGMPASSNECLIQINGGTLTLSAVHDALDSNGNIEINGGLVLVCGPNSGMDGAMDYDISAQVNGGTVLMTGSVANTRGLDQSAQAWTIASVQGAKGSNVALLDASGNEVASLTATQPFASVFASSSEIPSGSSFTIEVNGTPTLLTMG